MYNKEKGEFIMIYAFCIGGFLALLFMAAFVAYVAVHTVSAVFSLFKGKDDNYVNDNSFGNEF